ncbi:MAG: hypothetical protein GYA21_01755 [Myxococcales bacterium]|nr:hypothetical protein [Myxococcales bacterium]
MSSANDIEALVAAVTAEVMGRLNAARGALARRAFAFLLPLPGRALPRLLSAATELARRGNDVDILTAPQAEAALRKTGLAAAGSLQPLEAAAAERLMRGLESREVFVLGSASLSLLRRLAEREDDDPCVRLLLSARLRGCPVLMVCDDVEGEGPLGREAAERVRELTGLGMTAISSAGLETALRRLEAQPGTAARELGGLLTESDVERLFAAGERKLRLSRRTAVTPLARSRAAELGLILEREED